MKCLSKCEFRIYVEDTDYGGIVYHANYLRFLERGRTEWLHEIGLGSAEWKSLGLGFAVRTAKLDYLYPARLGEIVRVETFVKEFRRTAVTFYQTLSNKQTGKTLCTAEIVVVMVNEKIRPCAIPEVISQHLQ